jgi:folate-binding protein YgfZ
MSESHLVVAGTHEVVRVQGPGAATFLQGLISQDVESLDPVKARRSFLLGPQGKLRALLWVCRDGDRHELYTDAGYGQVVADDLDHYKIRVKAEISGPEPVWQVIGGIAGGVDASLPGLVRSFVREAPPLSEFMSLDRWRGLRIEAGEPVMGVDVDERTIPQETGLVADAVSFSKGCYLGQELVARIDTRGRVNRHLRGLLLEQHTASGAMVTVRGDEVGFVSSVGWSERLSANVGLALLKRTTQPGERVQLPDGSGLVVELPFA